MTFFSSNTISSVKYIPKLMNLLNHYEKLSKGNRLKNYLDMDYAFIYVCVLLENSFNDPTNTLYYFNLLFLE